MYPSDASFRREKKNDNGSSVASTLAAGYLSDVSGTIAPKSAALIRPGQIQSHSFLRSKMVQQCLSKYKHEFYYTQLEAVSQVMYKISDVNCYIHDEMSLEILIGGLASS